MRLILAIFFTLFSCSAYATQVVTPTVWNNGDTVTAAKLNGNQNAITNVVNGNIDNTNAATGYRLFQVVATLPSAGNVGNVAFQTSDNTLNLDNGATWLPTVTPAGTLGIGDFSYYNSGWKLLAPGTADYSLISNGTSSLPSYRQVPLGTGVTGVLSIVNGGTGSSAGANLIPTGAIIMWSGTIATIPSGWVLCNGSNGTPDLRNRFVVGADADSGGVAKSTVTGSALQTSNGQLPSTTLQSLSFGTGSAGSNIVTANSIAFNGTTANVTTFTPSFGTGSVNVATFYALAFIMKT